MERQIIAHLLRQELPSLRGNDGHSLVARRALAVQAAFIRKMPADLFIITIAWLLNLVPLSRDEERGWVERTTP